jgi:hypothetical protein
LKSSFSSVYSSHDKLSLLSVGDDEQWCIIITLKQIKYYDSNRIINNDSKIFRHAKLCQPNAREERGGNMKEVLPVEGKKSTAAWNLIWIEDGRRREKPRWEVCGEI